MISGETHWDLVRVTLRGWRASPASGQLVEGLNSDRLAEGNGDTRVQGGFLLTDFQGRFLLTDVYPWELNWQALRCVCC